MHTRFEEEAKLFDGIARCERGAYAGDGEVVHMFGGEGEVKSILAVQEVANVSKDIIVEVREVDHGRLAVCESGSGRGGVALGGIFNRHAAQPPARFGRRPSN